MTKPLYFFGDGKADGTGEMKSLLGGKGAGLAGMSRAGIPVPPGFTIATPLCLEYYDHKQKFPKVLHKLIPQYMARLEKSTARGFGDPSRPLLVSVRSGAAVSMPGMMDTILNLGLNDQTVVGLATSTSDPRFAYDCYRRFIMMFGNVVQGIEKGEFEHVIMSRKKEKGLGTDLELDPSDMKYFAQTFQEIYRGKIGQPFPQNPPDQLLMAVEAVFKSWNNPRAITYRNMYKIPHSLGTAVNVQSMVFGNMGNTSGTGVGFTRNPSTGEKKLYGEFLFRAQGEDVVAGVRTPLPIVCLKDEMPETFLQLEQIVQRLERHYRDVQDFEFTIQNGRLYMLQTRNGKRTGHAAVKIAVDLVHEKLISPEEAVMRVEPYHLEQLLHPVFDARKLDEFQLLARGLNASPGAAAGKAVFEADQAVTMAARGERVILVRSETSPDDIHGMAAARGVLTATGGMTSHAAVVCRQMGKPSIVGCSVLQVDEEHRQFLVDSTPVNEGDFISIDGTTGSIYMGDVPTRPSEVLQVVDGQLRPEDSEIYRYFATFMSWVDQRRTMRVRANADIPRDAQIAMKLGAEGIGLCRTEHMFFAEERVPLVQQMILAESREEIQAALKKLLPLQRQDFVGLFESMNGRPVIIRTLDPPLHEFLPKREELMVQLAQSGPGGSTDPEVAEKQRLLARVEELHEFNPMMGRRGCRLGITLPDITAMQAEAIFEAACDVIAKGIKVYPEIMIPLVGHVNELRNQKAIVDRTAAGVMSRRGLKFKYMVGTMIEIPRAAVTADVIAGEAEFFSFGTNDLTQMTLGFSRDDAGKFLPQYLQEGILEADPFATLDQKGVGGLIRMAVEKGKQARKDLEVGICGEHGGDPDSVRFFHEIGLDYVSCSPFRLPVARLAAAQASIKSAQGKPRRTKSGTKARKSR